MNYRLLILQSLLFFTISLCAVQISLANYTQIINNTHLIPVEKIRPPKPIVTQTPIIVYSSNILYVQFDASHNVAKSQTFTEQEFSILEKVASKIGYVEFSKFIEQSCDNKNEFMQLAKEKLSEEKPPSIQVAVQKK